MRYILIMVVLSLTAGGLVDLTYNPNAIKCRDVTGAKSNLCTLTDTDTTYTNGSGILLDSTTFLISPPYFNAIYLNISVCSGGEVYVWDYGCINNQSIGNNTQTTDTWWDIGIGLENNSNVLEVNSSYFTTTYYNPVGVGLISGVIDGGNITHVQHLDGNYDGITLNFSEEAGSPGLDIRINFTSIPDFNGGVMRYYTNDLKGVYPIIQLWSYTNQEWDDYPRVGESLSYATIEQPVFDSSGHLNNSLVQMRIYKVENGNTGNHYFIDWIAIFKGFGTPAGEEIDPISIHRDGNVSLTGNWDAGYNITAPWLFGFVNASNVLNRVDNDTIYDDSWINSTLYLDGECVAGQSVYNITGNIALCRYSRLESNISILTVNASDQASSIIALTSALGDYLPLAGGTMAGNIAMGGNDISGGGTFTSVVVDTPLIQDAADINIVAGGGETIVQSNLESTHSIKLNADASRNQLIHFQPNAATNDAVIFWEDTAGNGRWFIGQKDAIGDFQIYSYGAGGIVQNFYAAGGGYIDARGTAADFTITASGDIIWSPTGNNIKPPTDNTKLLGQTVGGNLRYADVKALLINGADFCYENNICFTECVNDLNQIDICFVYGKPTTEQRKTMGLVAFNNYSEYVSSHMDYVNETHNEFDSSMTETDFYTRRASVLIDGKIDFTFDREIHGSMRQIKSVMVEQNQRINALETFLCNQGAGEFCEN